jgi:hypothetical protein
LSTGLDARRLLPACGQGAEVFKGLLLLRGCDAESLLLQCCLDAPAAEPARRRCGSKKCLFLPLAQELLPGGFLELLHGGLLRFRPECSGQGEFPLQGLFAP